MKIYLLRLRPRLHWFCKFGEILYDKRFVRCANELLVCHQARTDARTYSSKTALLRHCSNCGWGTERRTKYVCEISLMAGEDHTVIV